VKRSGSSVGWNARSTYWHLTCQFGSLLCGSVSSGATEAFCDGHVRACRSCTTTAKSRWHAFLVTRQRTRVFSELQSRYLFQDRFGQPGKGNDKGKVEGLVGYARRNFLVPIPAFESFEGLNGHLLDCCRKCLGGPPAWSRRDDRRAASARSGNLYEASSAALRLLREAGDERLLAVAGAISAQRLFRTDDLRSPRSACARLCARRGDPHAVPRLLRGIRAPTSARTPCSTLCTTLP
jgi:hypothetical protein